MKHPEHEHQKALFKWAALTRLSELKHPVLPNMYLTDVLFAIPNGGKRSKAEAARFKAEGVKAGVPDVMLSLPCSGYSGLFIELKNDKPRGSVTMAQKAWLNKLNKAGYLALVCFGVDECIDVITAYLGNNRSVCEALKYAN